MTSIAPQFILISDDIARCHSLLETVAAAGDLHVPAHAEAALTLATSLSDVSGIIVDRTALDTGTVALVSKLRLLCPLASILVIAARLEVASINALHPLRVQLVARPLPADVIQQYVERALLGGRLKSDDLRQWLVRLSGRHRLSAGDLALIPLVLGDETPEMACERLGLDSAALGRGLRRIVRKCGVRNIDRLARNLWRDALLSSRVDARDWLPSPKFCAAI